MFVPQFIVNQFGLPLFHIWALCIYIVNCILCSVLLLNCNFVLSFFPHLQLYLLLKVQRLDLVPSSKISSLLYKLKKVWVSQNMHQVSSCVTDFFYPVLLLATKDFKILTVIVDCIY